VDSAACRIILTAAPNPAAARKLSQVRLQTLLRRAGRTRGIDAEAQRLHGYLRHTELRLPLPVEDAMGIQLQTLLRQLDAICEARAVLTDAAEELFVAYPGPTSSPACLGQALTGARLLAEIGDDPNRFSERSSIESLRGRSTDHERIRQEPLRGLWPRKERSNRGSGLCLGTLGAPARSCVPGVLPGSSKSWRPACRGSTSSSASSTTASKRVSLTTLPPPSQITNSKLPLD
jgi:hypothetical protein